MKRWGIVYLILISTVAQAATRQRLSMDFNWRFFRGDPPNASDVDFNDHQWRQLDLPHDWSIEGPYDSKNPTGGSGGYLPAGVGWYRKTFRVPADWSDKKISVQFDGVYQNSEVWINGHWLGKRPNGYISFSYDLTPYLNFGDEPNVIAVRVDNSFQPNSRWYSGSGIYRNVWLLETDALHVDEWGTYVTSPRVSAGVATVYIGTRIINETGREVSCTLATSVLDPNGRTVALARSADTIEAVSLADGSRVPGQRDFLQPVLIDDPSLWSPDEPNLYTVHSELFRGGQLVDEYDTPIGLRSIEFDLNKGFLLNGQHVKLNGVCLHHEAGAVGAAVPLAVWQRRLRLLKEMGCNAIRTSHNPPAPEFLDLCDRMGFLVMDESFDEWTIGKAQIRDGYHLYFNDWWERDASDMIRRDRNHPSIVIWSCGNEVPDQLALDGTQTLQRLVNLFHTMDPTRPVTAACDHAYSEPRSAPPSFMALLDVAGYNYVDRWGERADKYYDIDRAAYPQRKFIGTESGAMGGVRGDYRYLFPDPNPQPATRPFGFGRGFAVNRMIDVEQLWKFVALHDYVSGDFMWTGIDYLGESFWPSKSASSGVMDTCGFKKDGYFFYQSQWTDTPVLHLFPHWTWPGHEGEIIPVRCFTNCDTVELFLNDRSIGVKGYEFPRQGMEDRYGNLPRRARQLRTTSDLHLEWDVPYEPGVLRAVGKKDGRDVITDEVFTAGPASTIHLFADRDEILADRRDVAHITVSITDDAGHLVPTADDDVTFEITGPGRLIGVDNGNPLSHEDYKANHRQAFNGLCLAMIQTTDRPGKIHVTAHANGLADAEIDLSSVAWPSEPAVP